MKNIFRGAAVMLPLQWVLYFGMIWPHPKSPMALLIATALFSFWHGAVLIGWLVLTVVTASYNEARKQDAARRSGY